ncbi:hypothetical protein C4D60_Mb01t18570 [Musa balbisiana]|uniref:Uncharacterized protein n=2 Tax=Musa TaxID=4640 RepID=A0A4S8JPI1_MUSBA|nr:hypothetical protein C4D60_Mb01t18570 [Musa balbisiana]
MLGNSVPPAGGMEMTGMTASGSLGADRERFAPAADPALRQLNRRRRTTTSIARTVQSAQSRRSKERIRFPSSMLRALVLPDLMEQKVDNLSLYLAYYMILAATTNNL